MVRPKERASSSSFPAFRTRDRITTYDYKWTTFIAKHRVTLPLLLLLGSYRRCVNEPTNIYEVLRSSSILYIPSLKLEYAPQSIPLSRSPLLYLPILHCHVHPKQQRHAVPMHLVPGLVDRGKHRELLCHRLANSTLVFVRVNQAQQKQIHLTDLNRYNTMSLIICTCIQILA